MSVSEQEIENVWKECHVERIPGHDMTNGCRLGARIVCLRESRERLREALQSIVNDVGHDDATRLWAKDVLENDKL